MHRPIRLMAHGKADNLTTTDPSPVMIRQWLAPIRAMPPVFSIHPHVPGPIFGSLPTVLVVSGSLLERAVAGERELIARNVRISTRRAVTGLNRQIASSRALIMTLAEARSSRLAEPNKFHAQASMTPVPHDPNGQLVANTPVRFRAPPPAEPEPVRRVIEMGRPEISNLIRETETGRPAVSKSAPVWRDGELSCLLSVRFLNARAAPMSEKLSFSAQTAGHVDRDGMIICRATGPKRSMGCQSRFMQAIEGRVDRSYLTRSRQDAPDSRNRVRSMAVIHRTPFASTSFAKADLGRFLDAPVPMLTDAHGVNSGQIAVRVTMEPVQLSIKLAVPRGSVLNERITICFKHAFGTRDHTKIIISLTCPDDNDIMLSVSDDGAGIPDNLDIRDAGTLGSRLAGLLAGQVGGTITINRTHPTRFDVTFPKHEEET